MPAFISPIVNPNSWNCSATSLTIPAGLRYAGYTFRAVSATTAAGTVQMPATGVLRKVTSGGLTVVEVEVLPVPIRSVVSAVPGGAPTFYLAFPDATGLTFVDFDGAIGGETLRAATDVQIACVFQDRVDRDPALWASQLLDAITAGSGSPAQWQPFVDRLNATINTGATAPVIVLGPDGSPLTSGSVDAVLPGPGGGTTTHRIVLTGADGGDLQRAVQRMNTAGTLPIANLWGGGAASIRLRPGVFGGEDFQLARLEDRLTAQGEIDVTPAMRHVLFTDLTKWYAQQLAVPVGAVAAPLSRYSRGNKVTPFVNGPAFFDDLFPALRDAATAGGGFHLTGWAMFPQTKFVRRILGDDDSATTTLARAEALIGADGVPLTLEHAATIIANAGGACRFLPAQHLQLEPGTSVDDALILAAFLFISGAMLLSEKGVRFARMDGSGTVLLCILFTATVIFAEAMVASGAEIFQPTRSAVTVLSAVASTQSRYSPYPATIDDNPLVPNPIPPAHPLRILFDLDKHFGVYHQKFGIVKTAAGHIGYCGGIDLNADRLDDERHLITSPFHDVHGRIEGPAVSDIALSFEQRWTRDGGGTAVAFPTPAAGTLGTPGSDIVQIARTYFRPASNTRQLNFAPNGDSTIRDTMLKAIAQAREFIYIEEQYLTPPQTYTDAIVAKVGSGTLKKLIINCAGITTQPFGEVARGEFINAVRAVDPGGVVMVGYPRRRWTIPNNDLRASSGRLRLEADLPASGGQEVPILLGPKARVPSPPFWLAIDGELMWVHRTSTAPSPDSSRIVVMLADRGSDTRLVSASPNAGTAVRAHKALASATVVAIDPIYVHAKMIIIDDVFLGIGSANLNRRGYCHDGEMNFYSMREALKADPDNPVAQLRRRLWAEALDLPFAIAEPLMQDPIAASALFKRSPFLGNRFVDIDAQPSHLMLGSASIGGVFSMVMQTLIVGFAAAVEPDAYKWLSDPSSGLCD